MRNYSQMQRLGVVAVFFSGGDFALRDMDSFTGTDIFGGARYECTAMDGTNSRSSCGDGDLEMM